MPASKFQSVVLKPLTGIFDSRSSVDEMVAGSFRWKENFAISPDGRLARALGWVRAFPSVCYGNSDWHDQGVDDGSREPPTLLFASVGNDSVRRLFMGTKTRLFVHDPLATFSPEGGKGDWTQLTGGPFGSDGSSSLTQTRFHAAELQNKVVFTNNLDLVQIHTLGTATVAPIPSLALAGEAGFIGVTAAKQAIQFAGIMFLLNTVEGGKRFPSRIRWSDLNDADWWLQTDNHGVVSAGSTADFQDLDYGEIILNAIPLGGALYVFTDRSIWKCTPDVGVTSMQLSCVRAYTEPKNRARCLAYPNSLVSTGFSAFYFGADGIYEWNQYMSEPERPEWLHRSTTVIFKDIATRIDKQACNSPIAEYVPGVNEDATAGDGEIGFSWPIYDPPVELIPDANPDCVTFTPIDRVEDDGINEFTLVANLKHKTADFRPYGLAAMVNFTPDVSGTGGCNLQSVLLGASGADFCLKQLNTGDFLEMFDLSSGEYTQEGYIAVLRLVFPFDRPADEKVINSFLADLQATDPDDPAFVRLRVGTSHVALDPNPNQEGKCAVLWHQLSSKPIRCSYTRTAEQYVADNIRPGKEPVISWGFQYIGKFLFAELTVCAPDGGLSITGGCSISRLEVSARLK